MTAHKKRYITLPSMVLIVAGLLLPVAANAAAETIGKIIAVEGPVRVYRAEHKTLNELKMNGDVANADIIVTGLNAGSQIALSHHTALSVGPDSLVAINRQIDRKKKESHHITLLRGWVRMTSYGKILPENPNKALHIESPYGSFSFDGADLVVGVIDANVRSEGTISIPCPSEATKNNLGKLSDILADGGLPSKSSVVMEACSGNQENIEVEFVGFQQPKIRKKMISKSGIALVDAWAIAGEVGYTPPSKKRPVLTLEGGEEISFDAGGQIVTKK
jgi:hypothetical protein